MNLRQIITRSKDVSLWWERRNSARYLKCHECEAGELHSAMFCYEDYCDAYNSDLSPYPEVRVDDSDIQSCVEFSHRCDQSLWMTRSSKSLSEEKVRKDNVAGKVGEFVVRNTLIQMGLPVDDPDLEIYDARQKSFDADLHFNTDGMENGISVKTFRIHDGLPSKVSWVMQWSEKDNGRGVDRHYFGSDDSIRLNQWFAGVALSPDLRHGRILAMIPMQTLYDAKVYEPLENEKFSHTKRAVYWDTLVRRGLVR